MPRRAEIQPRQLEPDAVHGSVLVTQLVNRLMLNGKKSVAEQMVYDALSLAAERTGRSELEVLEQAVKSVTPVLEVRSRRVGGANYQVPVEVPQRRARTLALRWIVVDLIRDQLPVNLSVIIARVVVALIATIFVFSGYWQKVKDQPAGMRFLNSLVYGVSIDALVGPWTY